MKFSTWLHTIVSNLMRDQFRWRARQPRVSIVSVLEFVTLFAQQFMESPVYFHEKIDDSILLL